MAMLIGVSVLAFVAPALAGAGGYLKSDGMWGHVGRAIKQPHEHVVRVKMIGGLREVERAFVALTDGPKGKRYVYGTVHAPSGKVTTTKVEKVP
jgi:hypothetical protein